MENTYPISMIHTFLRDSENPKLIYEPQAKNFFQVPGGGTPG